MEPTLKDGDLVVLTRVRPKTGRIVLVDHPRLGRIIKRLSENGRLRGDSPNSTASVELGHLKDCQLIGVARLAITPRGIYRL